MRAVITIALLLAVAQVSASQVEQVISVQHDSRRGATCWILNDAAISCLPDSSLPQSSHATATPSSEAVRASQAISAHQNEQLQTTPLLQDERFQL
ncbi:hypothetical protein [Pseudomonas fluorescens]|uniref:Uncharacterized protein n=1 Tax=Pseudomonas fluorescens TaxID=294 RepID=A0A5E7ECN3_PSEFL|nr:hypothetical protein [Pseudomonas fluorescens]VVO24468.1 hypothetical protein PS710_04510 [Pseudomonas fluorescens]